MRIYPTMATVILCVFLLICQHIYADLQSSKYPLVKLSLNQLSNWYDPLSFCMISSNSTMKSFWELHHECSKSLSTSDMNGLMPLTDIPARMNDVCCLSNIPLGDRGFNVAIEGYENAYSTKPLVTLLNMLKRTNKHLVFVGDSLTRQAYAAFKYELKREGIESEFQELEALNLLTEPFKGTKVYKVWSSGGNRPSCQESDEPAFGMITNLMKKHPEGLVFIFNVGLHMSYIPNNPRSIKIMTDHALKQLEFIQQFKVLNPKNMIIFRETTPSNFDGVYNDGHFSTKYPTVQNNNTYQCSYNTNHTSSLDITIIKNILKNWNDSSIHYLDAYDYFTPYYNMHYGTCNAWNVDCVHYCGFSPIIWMPLWANTLKLYNNLQSSEENDAENSKNTENVILYKEKMSKHFYVVNHGVKRKVESIEVAKKYYDKKFERIHMRVHEGNELKFGHHLAEGQPLV